MIQNNAATSLTDARTNKIVDLKDDLQAFRDLGFVYTGWTFNLSANSAVNVNWKNNLTPNGVNPWRTGVTYVIDDFVFGTDSKIYKSLINSNTGNNPVPTPGSNWVEYTNIPDRFKFYDLTHIQRDFTDNAGFTLFAGTFLKEEDRIMVLYNSYRGQIAACTTVAEVDAITISFAP